MDETGFVKFLHSFLTKFSIGVPDIERVDVIPSRRMVRSGTVLIVVVVVAVLSFMMLVIVFVVRRHHHG